MKMNEITFHGGAGMVWIMKASPSIFAYRSRLEKQCNWRWSAVGGVSDDETPFYLIIPDPVGARLWTFFYFTVKTQRQARPDRRGTTPGILDNSAHSPEREREGDGEKERLRDAHTQPPSAETGRRACMRAHTHAYARIQTHTHTRALN